MAVRMRLRREGKKKQPYYRIVVADVRSPRDGRFIEDLGYYQPLGEPSTIGLDHERALHWLRNGAQPSSQVTNLLRIEGVWEQFRPGEADAEAARRERREQRRTAKEASRDRSAQEPAPAPAPTDAGTSGDGETTAEPGEAGEPAAQEEAAEPTDGEEPQS